MRLWERLLGRGQRATVSEYISWAAQAGPPMPSMEQTLNGTKYRVSDGAHGAKAAASVNSVVASVMDVRQAVFSQVRFRGQTIRNGKPADLFGTPELSLLERPWTGGQTTDLLVQMIQDADLSGNSFWTPAPVAGPTFRGRAAIPGVVPAVQGDPTEQLVRLDPSMVDIVVGEVTLDGQTISQVKLGYVHYPRGRNEEGVIFRLDQVAHFMPTLDPWWPFRGMSWLTPVAREIEADQTMTLHKRKFFENGATPNLIITHAAGADRQKITDFQKRLDAESRGTQNAYRTLNLYPGADATVVGADLKSVDFKQVQGAGETRIAAAGGVPPVIVGLSEGLQAATYSNYAQARRRFSDGTMHPLWAKAAAALQNVFAPGTFGPGARLWYDHDNIAFLREDEKDAAEIARTRAATLSSYLAAGFTPESAVAALEADDIRLLQHTGLFSVQLQPPGSTVAQPSPAGGTE